MGGVSENQELPSHRLFGMSFGVFTSNEIKQLSVKEITNPQSFDALLHPTYGGLYDPALGPTERDDICRTCGLNSMQCPGHMGHVVLPLPVYNPVLFRTLVQLMKGLCVGCDRLLMKTVESITIVYQMRALDKGLLCVANEMQEILSEVLINGGGDKGVADHLKSRLEKRLAEAWNNIDCQESVQYSSVKNVTERRKQLLKNFLRGNYFKSPCPHCAMPARPLRAEHHSKLFFCKGLKKKVAIAILRKRQRETTSQTAISQGDQMVKEEVPEADQVTMEDSQGQGDQVTSVALEEEKELAKLMEEQTYITPTFAREHFRQLWKNEPEILRQVFGTFELQTGEVEYPTDIFFIDILPVPPSRFRPVSVMREKRFDNPQTANMAKILSDAWTIREILAEKRKQPSAETQQTIVEDKSGEQTSFTEIPGQSINEKLNNVWIRMQTHVNCMVDSDLDKLSTEKNPGIKQLLEKKEGLFRMHMMGKRVNYAARSVISPDPYISTNEIGIPDVFAKKLTYPQPVTPWNFQELKQAVMNGPLVHPGACFVENQDGSKTMLSATDWTQREAIAKQLLTPIANMSPMLPNKKVYRHLKNGDVLLLNRQPTLHKPSIQAHKARILPGEKTLRLHYANCKAYNADFDGDEMNAHFPQSELARAEAYSLIATDHQYLVPKDGTPLAGLIQDHMVSGVSLMMRGRFFNRAEYQQLVFSALTDCPGRVKLLPPTIIKPGRYWSGKQILSSVLLNLIPKGSAPLNLTGKAKISGKNWVQEKPRPWFAGGEPLEGDDMSESQVIIQQGELLVGVMDKGHYGNTPYGLIHCCYELYGGVTAGKLLTCLAKLFTTFLQWRGFTLGVADILCTEKADHKRRKVMKHGKRSGPGVAAKALGVNNYRDSLEIHKKYQEAHFSQDGGEQKDLDLTMKGNTDEIMNDIVKVIMPLGLLNKFPVNNLQLMVQSGAKGSMVNCMQISCLLGQIELEGRRPPLMMSGQFLPSFLSYDPSPRAGGFVDGRFLTGIRPQEYFFHCMAGREGLVDTAVKTSRSGYLQRCLIKHMEGLALGYDLTVRDSDGSIVQFSYGEDGLDVPNIAFLDRKQFPFLIHNKDAIVSEEKLQEVCRLIDSQQAPKAWKKLKKWKKKNKSVSPMDRSSAFLNFSKKKWASVIDDTSNVTMTTKGRSMAASHVCTDWQTVSEEKKAKYGKHTGREPDPVMSRYRPDRHFGSMSERFEALVTSYIKDNPDKLLVDEDSLEKRGTMTADRFKSLLYLRHIQSLSAPGEAVGLLASQSIGEPSTQMTLNTFHFAGRGEMNVTLGIPRLREILMVASAQIKTPNMNVQLKQTGTEETRGRKLQKSLNKVYISQVLEDVEVVERLCVHDRVHKHREYRLRFSFLPHEMYKDQYCVTPAQILHYMERKFFRNLQDAIKRRMIDMEKTTLLTSGKVRTQADKNKEGAVATTEEADEDIAEDYQHDGDATADKTRERQMGERDYEGEEEEMKEIGQEQNESDNEEPFITDDGPCTPKDERSEDEGEESRSPSPVNITTTTTTPAKKARRPSSVAKMDDSRVSAVLSFVKQVCKYEYDVDHELWCEITYKYGLGEKKIDLCTLVEAEARKAVVWQTPGITRSFLNQSRKPGEEGLWRLSTEGVNIQEMYKYHDILALNTLYTNDIHATARTYGIEAASRVLIKEVRDVFAAYGIQVDYRHLSLVADYMTFEGVYKAFNRVGLESNASPLQKMSFETTMHFLKGATIHGEKDELKSPSSCVVVGRVVKSGTGSFDLLQPLC